VKQQLKERYHLSVNGAQVEVEVEPDTPLLSVLRNDLDLKGARFGCGVGLCGACFVKVGDAVVPSCETPMWSVGQQSVVTVEGLAEGDALHPVQAAFLDEQAAQCGYCISGILVRAAALLDANPRPDESAVLEALERNLCRCGVQRRIVQAIVKTGQESR
jgi:nicotinate dehydrogenase subunit A